MRSLNDLQAEWVSKFNEMRQRFPGQLASPLLTVKPCRYDPDGVPSILYVGKASGPNEPQDADVKAHELREHTKNFLKNIATIGAKAGFFKFGLNLSKALADHTGHSKIPPLQNLVWTNICKIGVCKGTPKKEIYELQKSLAVETLRAEIDSYRPKLVFWAIGDYGLDVLQGVIDNPNKGSWIRKDGEKSMCWRELTSSSPAMLWTYHPERKPKEILNLWIDQACTLVSPRTG